MLIEKDNVKRFLQIVKDKFEIGSDTVFCPKKTVKPDDLDFCCGPEDQLLFCYHHPMDIDFFESYDLRTFYETLVLLDKNKIPINEYTRKNNSGEELIDVGSLVKKRNEDKLKRIQYKPRIIRDYNSNSKIKR